MSELIEASSIRGINFVEEKEFHVNFIEKTILKRNYFLKRLEYLKEVYATGSYEEDKHEILEEMDDIVNYWLYNLNYLIKKHEKIVKEIDLKIKIGKCRVDNLEIGEEL